MPPYHPEEEDNARNSLAHGRFQISGGSYGCDFSVGALSEWCHGFSGSLTPKQNFPVSSRLLRTLGLAFSDDNCAGEENIFVKKN